MWAKSCIFIQFKNITSCLLLFVVVVVVVIYIHNHLNGSHSATCALKTPVFVRFDEYNTLVSIYFYESKIFTEKKCRTGELFDRWPHTLHSQISIYAVFQTYRAKPRNCRAQSLVVVARMLHSRHDSIPIWICCFVFLRLFCEFAINPFIDEIKSQNVRPIFLSHSLPLDLSHELIYSAIGIGNRN